MSRSTDLISTLTADTAAWLASQSAILTNERHMQVELTMWLRATGHYTDVATEYCVPLNELRHRGIDVGSAEFPWTNQLSIDIVVEKDGIFAAVELKYNTKHIDHQFRIFSESFIDSDSRVIKNQAAGDIVMYNYWKDVRRIETLKKAFPNVVGGIALIITNSPSIWNPPTRTVVYENFSLHQGRKVEGGPMVWLDHAAKSIQSSHPAFTISGTYLLNWHDTAIRCLNRKGQPEFKYLISII